ncbi:threonine/homoserine efflux transporter RhtA [Marinomonas balearica]|uniref:Threonine/homoserine efflux transporter RhtA n=2 Tax=Marinomonas balearica TaxID=491947 RepID=A0A4R6MCQ8_9GAMM|nr:threonine/homoserine efflux transporter RhtA [Marinomonas balearica]
MSFTTLRLVSGAAVLVVLLTLLNNRETVGCFEIQEFRTEWFTPLSLLVYAAGFSYAYVSLPAGMGALLLFGAVQFSMICYGLYSGERLNTIQWIGLLVAVVGVLVLFLPGATAPSLWGSVLMVTAGIGWAFYTVRGKGASKPVRATGSHFVKASVISLLISIVLSSEIRWDGAGALYAVLAGGVTSGLGYALWYFVLPSIKVATAATLQLSVPVIAIIMGLLFLEEQATLHLFLSCITILGGIFLYIFSGMRTR